MADTCAGALGGGLPRQTTLAADAVGWPEPEDDVVGWPAPEPAFGARVALHEEGAGSTAPQGAAPLDGAALAAMRAQMRAEMRRALHEANVEERRRRGTHDEDETAFNGRFGAAFDEAWERAVGPAGGDWLSTWGPLYAA
eukprot:1209676-Prymnesium_polylepis.1